MFLEEYTESELEWLKKILTYYNKSVEYQIKAVKHYGYKYSHAWVKEKLMELESKRTETLLYYDSDGLLYTRPGILHFIKEALKRKKGALNQLLTHTSSNNNEFHIEVVNQIEYPEFKLIPWEKTPPYKMRPHQQKAVEIMLNNPHGHIEYATGTGKSLIIMNLIKNVGLPTVVSTPSVSIAKQLYDQAVELFGKKRVGLLGGGKKQLDKFILIAVGKSLALIKKESELDKMKKYQVFISDESHTLPASTFEYFCHTVLGHCFYRWFVSGTQTRAAGDDLKLQAIIGPRLATYTIQEAIQDGVLAKLKFFIFDVKSSSTFYDPINVVKMNQEHFYYNETIAKTIADLAHDALLHNKPTLILVDEHNQELLLRRYMKIDYAYACADSDVSQIVKDFNDGKIMTVVGTSAVSVGTDFKSVQLTINWQAGRSPIKIKQGAIGRSTRLDSDSGKTECIIVDFRVINVPTIKRHANARIAYYEEIGDVEYIILK